MMVCALARLRDELRSAYEAMRSSAGQQTRLSAHDQMCEFVRALVAHLRVTPSIVPRAQDTGTLGKRAHEHSGRTRAIVGRLGRERQ